MDPTIIVAIATALVIGRHLAARRVAVGDGRFVWVVFTPTLVIGVGLVWAALADLPASPVVGVLLAIGGAIYLVSAVRATLQAVQNVNRAQTPDDIATAVTDPFVEHMVVLISLMLIGGVIAVAALIAWGVSRAAG